MSCDCMEKLITFCKENKFCIGGCGCCGSPWLECEHDIRGETVPRTDEEEVNTSPIDLVPPDAYTREPIVEVEPVTPLMDAVNSERKEK